VPLPSPPPPDPPERPPPPQQPPFHHVGAPSTQPRLQRTFGHLLLTRSRLPTALPALTPHFHAYRADPNYVALVQERASDVVCNVQVRDLRPCGSDAPRLGLRACRLAIEWPLARNARAPPLPPPESQVARRHAI
jgi:hypothetical protein